MTSPLTTNRLPPVLRAEELARQFAAAEIEYPDVRAALLGMAVEAHARGDFPRLAQVMVEVRRVHFRRRAAETRRALAWKRNPFADDEISLWYAALLSETLTPPDPQARAAEAAARYRKARARREPQQVLREQVQKQGGGRAVGLNVPQEGPWQPGPALRRTILHRPPPGSAAPVEQIRPLPRGKRVLNTIRQQSVAHLARVLYLAHLHGWESLTLSESYGRPSEVKRVPSSGYVEFVCRCAFDTVIMDVAAIITSNEYRRALEQLTPQQRTEIRQYYLRSASGGDVCPALGRWEYQATTAAFAALLDALFAQGALT